MTQMETQIFDIRGMHCAACAQRIEKVVGKLPGVARAMVNLASEKLFAEYDGAALAPAAMQEAVAKIGFEAVLPEAKAADADRTRKQKEIKTLWVKFAVSAVFSLPLLYIAMVPMLTRSALPFAGALHHMMMDSPLAYALAQLLLALPPVGVGYQFYTGGFRAFWGRSPNMDSLIAVGTSAALLYSAWNTCRPGALCGGGFPLL